MMKIFWQLDRFAEKLLQIPWQIACLCFQIAFPGHVLAVIQIKIASDIQSRNRDTGFFYFQLIGTGREIARYVGFQAALDLARFFIEGNVDFSRNILENRAPGIAPEPQHPIKIKLAVNPRPVEGCLPFCIKSEAFLLEGRFFELGIQGKRFQFKAFALEVQDGLFARSRQLAAQMGEKDIQLLALAPYIGIGLEAFCIPGSVAEQRQVGLGHGNLGAMLLSDESKCFAFLAGHESFAAAEGAIGIVRNANKARKEPLRVILNGLGKDAAQIISRINGFTYVQTQFDYGTGEVKVVKETRYSEGERANVRCYGADDVREGVAIMHLEGVDVSITGNSTNPTRFQHPVAGTYKKECVEQGKKYFSVASGGGTGRTLHPDNMAAGPASYGMTDTMGRMHSDAQFAGSSSVPAHVEMMGFLGMGNNPMVGATVAVAVAVAESLK